MRKQVLPILAVAGIVAIVAMILLLRRDNHDTDGPARAEIPGRATTIGQQPLHAPRSGKLAPPPAATRRPDKPDVAADAADPDLFPTIADLSGEGRELATAYREARDTMLAQFLARQHRRCFRRHRGNQKEIEWTGLETYAVTDGVARLAGLQLTPSFSQAQPFIDCISPGQVGSFEFRVPAGTPHEFTVREGGGIIHYAEPATAELRLEIADLTERLKRDSRLSSARRELLEQHVALWQCYADRGPAKRDECANEIDGE